MMMGKGILGCVKVAVWQSADRSQFCKSSLSHLDGNLTRCFISSYQFLKRCRATLESSMHLEPAEKHLTGIRTRFNVEMQPRVPLLNPHHNPFLRNFHTNSKTCILIKPIMEPQQRAQFTGSLQSELLKQLNLTIVKPFNSFANIVFLVKDENDRELVLRIAHGALRSKVLIEEELRWLQHLHQTLGDKCTAHKVVPLKGQQIHTIQSKEHQGVEFYAVAFSLEKGADFMDLDPKDRPNLYQNIGRFVGQMHAATKSFPEREDGQRRFTYLEEFCYSAVKREEKNLTEQYPFVKEKYESLLKQVTDFMDREKADYGLIHGDVQPSNYLIDDSLKIRLFDFDASCYCHFVMDISNVVFYNIQRHEEQTQEEMDLILDNFMKGYREEYQLTNEAEALKMIDVFMWLRLTIMFIYFIPQTAELFETLKKSMLHDLKNCDKFVDCTTLKEFHKLVVSMHQSKKAE